MGWFPGAWISGSEGGADFPPETRQVPEPWRSSGRVARAVCRLGRWVSRWDNALFIVLLAVVAILFARRQGYLLASPAEELLAGDQRQQAPAFVLPALHGASLGLEAYRGKVVLLNFWATWCPPCRAEMASMEELYRAYSHHGLILLAVSTDAGGAEVVRPYIQARDLTFPVLLDPTGAVAHRYAVRVLPTTYLIDQAGQIVAREVGARDWAGTRARRLVERVLAEAAVPVAAAKGDEARRMP